MGESHMPCHCNLCGIVVTPCRQRNVFSIVVAVSD